MTKETIKGWVLKEVEDGSINLEELVKHGCVSGCVSSLIYYEDTVLFHDKFEDDDIPDLIILDKHKYQWILKGCKLIKKEYIPTSYKPIGNSFKTHLTISYESRSGSHIKEVIKGEIRDWNIDKIIGL